MIFFAKTRKFFDFQRKLRKIKYTVCKGFFGGDVLDSPGFITNWFYYNPVIILHILFYIITFL